MSISPKLNAITQGDVLSVLQSWPDAIVQTVVTSPPYWGLRDYKVDGQLGLETNVDDYLEKMVRIFAEVRRVLKKDGTLWLNLGDSYAGAASGMQGKNGQRADRRVVERTGMHKRSADFKSKDLIGIPWLVAFALRSDGWFLRSDIIWSKPNPMPESVQDRPTKAHEYIFLMSKSSKYFYDATAIKEPAKLAGDGAERVPAGWNTGEGDHRDLTGRYAKPNGKWSTADKQSAGRRIADNVARARGNGADHDSPFGDLRNKRSVWDVPTQAFPGAHFATYPEDLIAPCIKAGSRSGDVVLDPFMGSGTTAVVAKRFKRNWLGVELNPVYIEIAKRRISVEQEPLLVE